MPRPRRGYARRRGYAPPRKGRGRGRARPRDDEDEEEYYPPPKSKAPILILAGFTLVAVALVVVVLATSGNRPGQAATPPGGAGAFPGDGAGGEARFCPSCNGTGRFDCPDCDMARTNCSTCDGFGYRICAACDGTGR